MPDTTFASDRTLPSELRALRDAHARVHRLLDLGHFSVDLATDTTIWSDELFALARMPIPADSSPGGGAEAIRCHAHPDDAGRVLADLRAVLKTGRVHHIEYRAVRGDAPVRWVGMIAAREDDADGKPIQIVGTVVDITQRKTAQERLEFTARHDMLTGLANRLHLHERLSSICAEDRELDAKGAILFLGLDGFKRINDNLGHVAGDLLLQSAAARLQSLHTGAELIARNGGDEFVVVLAGAAASDAAAAACKIAYAFADPLTAGDRDVSVGASIGIACYPEDGGDVETLIRNADTAMCHAKRDERGSYRFFEESMHAAAVRRFTLETELRLAIQRSALIVHYQPVVTIDGRLIGSEALVRWAHHGRTISAAEFVPIAEETGLIAAVDAFVLNQACRQNAVWQRRGRRLQIAVNVSARTIAKTDFTATVRNALRDSGLDPVLLELELTESALQGDLAETARKVDEVRALGVGVALDDFGTGYNSLAILRTCRFDTVKLDRTFVSDIVTHRADAIIAEAVIVAAHRLGARVVAEGVETEQQRATLAGLGCDHSQGYLFGAALAATDFDTLFAFARLPSAIVRVA